MSEHPADETAVTKPSVVPGMGYPNGREEESPTPIGWQGSGLVEVDKIPSVSRETLGEKE